MQRIKIFINEKCIGCGACIAIAPEVFEFNEEGFSSPKVEIVEKEDLIEKIEEAKETCPVKAIEIKTE